MKLRVRVPATTSNLGAGFDCFGMALSLHLEATLVDAPALTVTAEGADVPLDRSNLVVRTFLETLPAGMPEPKVAIHLRNRIPLARGLGSSASARAAGVALGLAYAAGGPQGIERTEISRRVTGLEHHPDNATPAVHGGFCICAGTRFERVEMNARRYLILVPNFEIHTESARAALPRQRSLEDAVFNLQHAALAAARVALHKDLGAMAPFEDRLHQSYRLALEPKLQTAFAAVSALASVEAVFLSGSGSTVFVLPRDFEEARSACTSAFTAAGLGVEALPLQADNAGLVLEGE